MGRWHKVRRHCDFCGHYSRHNITYIVDDPKIKGQFCSDRHAKFALKEMEEVRNENL